MAALGTILRWVILHTGNHVAGLTLVPTGCAFMFLGGPIMAVADRLGLCNHKG